MVALLPAAKIEDLYIILNILSRLKNLPNIILFQLLQIAFSDF